jgi:hypothetical protein
MSSAEPTDRNSESHSVHACVSRRRTLCAHAYHLPQTNRRVLARRRECGGVRCHAHAIDLGRGGGKAMITLCSHAITTARTEPWCPLCDSRTEPSLNSNTCTRHTSRSGTHSIHTCVRTYFGCAVTNAADNETRARTVERDGGHVVRQRERLHHAQIARAEYVHALVGGAREHVIARHERRQRRSRRRRRSHAQTEIAHIDAGQSTLIVFVDS